MLNEDEDELVERSRRGDLSAFNQLVLFYQSLVFNLCFRLLGQRQTAEDAAQEAFISAWRNLNGLRGAFRPWLLRIAANACTDELRRRSRRPSSSLDAALEDGMPEPDDPASLPEEDALDAETRRELEVALSQLPHDQRIAIILCDIDGLDYAEIAGVTGVSLGTVKSRIARGRARMRQILQRRPELLPARFRLKDEDHEHS